MRFLDKLYFAVLALGAGAAMAADPVERARSVLEQWVETERIQSREAADWTLERSILTESVALLRSEEARLKAAIEALTEDEGVVVAERAQLNDERHALTEASAVVTTALAPLEERLRAAAAGFPAPLLQQVQPLLRRIPADPENTRLSIGERVQNLVGILGEADKFNNTLTLSREIREIEGGRSIEVRTLYIGLSCAYFTDSAGETGGIGLPGATGWEWTRSDSAARSIGQLIDVYEGIGEVRFIEVPARSN